MYLCELRWSWRQDHLRTFHDSEVDFEVDNEDDIAIRQTYGILHPLSSYRLQNFILSLTRLDSSLILFGSS